VKLPKVELFQEPTGMLEMDGHPLFPFVGDDSGMWEIHARI
jgi:hypothetical protein